jgi:hypothetical protein
MEVATPELVERLATLVESGVPVLRLGDLPERAPGFHDMKNRDARVRAAVKRLAAGVVVVPQGGLEATLASHVRAAVVEPLAGERLAVSIERRQTVAGVVVLLVNESWDDTTVKLRFTRVGGELAGWDPWSGEKVRLRDSVAVGDEVELELEAAQSVVLTLAVPGG